MGGAAKGERELVHAPHGDHISVTVRRGLVLLVYGAQAAERVVARVMKQTEPENRERRERLPDGNPLVVRGGRLAEQARHAHEDGRDDESYGHGHGEQCQIPEVDEQVATRTGAIAVLELGRRRREEVQGQIQGEGEGPGDVLEDDADGADPGDQSAAVADALGLEHQHGPGSGKLGHAPDVEHGHIPGHIAVNDGGEEVDHAPELVVDGGHARVGGQIG